MNQSKENRNGCKEQTEKEKNVMESIMNEFSEYICDHLCKYPEQIKDQEELEEQALLEEWLSTKRGQKVTIRIPKKG